MVAMKNATDNAKQFIKDLTLEYNKMRQASITNELLEITTAQMALGVSRQRTHLSSLFMNKGNIVQVIGPIVDVDFGGENTALPKIYNALEVEYRSDGQSDQAHARSAAASW